jgi:hypothetical protein
VESGKLHGFFSKWQGRLVGHQELPDVRWSTATEVASRDSFHAGLREGVRLRATEQDVPDEFVSFLTNLFGEVLDGRSAHLTDGNRRAQGREPQDFTKYVRDATDVWDGRR